MRLNQKNQNTEHSFVTEMIFEPTAYYWWESINVRRYHKMKIFTLLITFYRFYFIFFRYSFETHQRSTDLRTTKLDTEPDEVKVANDDLIIKWKDGRESCFKISWLEQNYFWSASSQPKLWSKVDQQEVLKSCKVSWDEFQSTDTGVKSLISSIIK